MKPARIELWMPPLLSLVLITATLEWLLSISGIPEYLLPRPSTVMLALLHNAGELSKASLQTALAAGSGLLASALIGALIAILLCTHPWVRRAFYP